MLRAIYEQTRRKAGRSACPSVVIMDGQSVKTTERGVRGFDAHKRVRGRQTPHPLSVYWACRSPVESSRPTSPIGGQQDHRPDLGLWSAASLGSVAIADSAKTTNISVQTSETLIDIAAIRIMLNRLAPE
jgi:hypothetical protein